MVNEHFTITGVKLAWKDNGHKMFRVSYTRNQDGSKWVMCHWARDELDAYTIAMKLLAKEEQAQ